MLFNQGDAQQFNGREGETATLLFRCPLNSTLREFGFAPSRPNRSAFGDFINRYRRDNKNFVRRKSGDLTSCAITLSYRHN